MYNYQVFFAITIFFLSLFKVNAQNSNDFPNVVRIPVSGSEYLFNSTRDNWTDHTQSQAFKLNQAKGGINPSDLKGSPYASSGFKNGTIIDYLANIYDDVNLRYNIYNDVFEVRNYQEKKDTVLVARTESIGIKYNGSEYNYKKYLNRKGKSESGYLRNAGFINGKKVYVRTFQKLRLPKEAKTTLEKDIQGAIRNYYLLVIESENGSRKAENLNRRQVLKSVSKENRNRAEQIIDEKALTLKNPEELITLITALQS